MASNQLWWFLAPLLIAAGMAISAGLIVALQPLLKRYAMARPNARSSHKVPTPQGGGIAVVAATISVICVAILTLPNIAPEAGTRILPLFGAIVLLAFVGAVDDIRAIGVAPRLLLQALATIALITALPLDIRVIPFAPWWIERLLLLLAGIWFINLVNFMDGIDWMTVAEVIAVTAGLAIAGALGALPASAMLWTLALAGAIFGFAPFNRPVATLFLGDGGSLPIGLLLFWLLVQLAGSGHLAAAVLLPLYYLADTTITLARRMAEGERIVLAHRSHFYQRATNSGYSVTEVIAHVTAINVALVALATATVIWPTALVGGLALIFGCLVVGLLLWRFEQGKS